MMMKPMEQAGETPAVGKDIIEVGDVLVEAAESELMISKRGVHATVNGKSTIEMVDTFTRTADTKWIESKNSTGIFLQGTLLGNGQAEARMIQPETTQKALKAEIKNEVLQELHRVEMKPTGGGAPAKGNQDGKRTNPNIICNKCKEKGHIAKNCPKNGTKKDGGKDKSQKPNPYKEKPKEGEAHVKTINSVECSWCEQCY